MSQVTIHRTRLGRTNLMVSAIGIGTWSAAGTTTRDGLMLGWGDGDDVVALETLSMAFARGVNFVDTSQTYGFGRTKLLVGEALFSVLRSKPGTFDDDLEAVIGPDASS